VLDRRIEELLRIDAQEALRLAKFATSLGRHAGDYHAGIATRAQANALRLLARYGEAVACYAAAEQRFHAAGDVAEAARTLVGKVDALIYRGDYTEALDTAAQARAVLQQEGDSLAVAKLDMNVGNVHFHRDHGPEALRYYRRAERAFRSLHDDLHVAAAEANVGNVLVQLDRFEAALAALSRSRGRYARLGLPLMVATLDLNIGYAWSCRGLHLRALDHLLSARRVFLEQNVPVDVATANLDMAQSYLALNMLAEAAESSWDAAGVFLAEGMARELGQALVYQAESVAGDEPMRAAELLDQAYRTFHREGNRVWCAVIDLRLSTLTPQPEEALRLARRAADALSGLGLRRRAIEGWLAEANAAERLGDSKRADGLYRLGYEAASQLGLTELCARALQARARLQRSMPLYRKASELYERVRATLGAESLRAGFASRLATLYEEMTTLLVADGVNTAELFAVLEAARARTLADDMTRNLTKPYATARRSDRLEALRQQVRSLQRRLTEAELEGASARVERLQAETSAAESVLVRAVHEEEIIHAARGEPSSSRTVALDEVQRALHQDDMLIEYFSTGDSIGALCVRVNDVQVFPRLASTEEVASLAARLRFQLNACGRHGREWVANQGERLLSGTQSYLHALHDQVVRPLDLAGSRRLLIVPHGVLHGLPFHALHDGRGYLLERHEVAMSPSATVAFCFPDRRPTSDKPLVMGVEDQYAPLAGAEARQVARSLGARPYTGMRATRSAFLRRAPTASIIHLAAHASLRDDNPHFSAIHFADGPLTMQEVMDLRFQADLAVLSGCATGVGTERAGQEVMSLARAFLSAGVQDVLVSLWPVEDTTTTSLMSDFYDARRHQGAGPALRAAQLGLLQSNPHPYFWAAFTMVSRGK